MSSGVRITVANTKNARPAERKMSPTEATLFSGQKGIGIRSLSGPRWRKNSGPEPISSGVCRTDDRGPARPEISYAGIQTGMRPPLPRIAIALLAMPMNASARPGYPRFFQSVYSSNP